MVAEVSASTQLAALARLIELLGALDYWLFGGWAVDFHAHAVTRAHGDLDVAVWERDLPAISTLLERDGWQHAPDDAEDGYTTYVRAGVRMDLAFLARSAEGVVCTPLRVGRAAWPEGAFGTEVLELAGVRARVISRRALVAEKSEPREDLEVAAKDRADCVTLLGLS